MNFKRKDNTHWLFKGKHRDYILYYQMKKRGHWCEVGNLWYCEEDKDWYINFVDAFNDEQLMEISKFLKENKHEFT